MPNEQVPRIKGGPLSNPLNAIFLTVFLDLMNFGTVIPDIQLRARSLGATGFMIGLVISMYSLSQFIFAPMLGRWSDKVGRRRVLLVTSAMATLASLVYAFAHSIPTMLVSRAFLGVAGANLGVAYAYVSDVSTPDKRAAAMGKIGMAFGLGFMFGPPLGSAMVMLGHGGPLYLGLVSAVFGFANFLYVYLVLPDAKIRQDEGSEFRSMGQFQKLVTALKTPGLGYLLVLFLVANVAFTNLESTYFFLARDDFNLSQMQTSLILVFIGLVGAGMQGGAIPKLVTMFGETKLLRVAYVIQAPALAIVPFAPPWLPLLAVALALGIGTGLAQPSLSSLISRAAPPTMVGGIFGVTQALGAIARIIGPQTGNDLYAIRHWAPYGFAATLMIVPLVMAQFVRKPSPRSA